MFLNKSHTKNHDERLESLNGYRLLIDKCEASDEMKAAMHAKVDAKEKALRDSCFERQLADGRIHIRHPNFGIVTTEIVEIEPQRLCGSYITSNQVIRLKVFGADAFVDADGVADYQPTEELAVVDFTANQFSNMVAGRSMGETTPCTFRSLKGYEIKDLVSDILPLIPPSFLEGVREDLIKHRGDVLALADEVRNESGKMSDKRKKERSGNIENRLSNLASNSGFASRQLAEIAGKVTEQKRSELELFSFAPKSLKGKAE